MWTFDPFGKASTDTKSEEYKERLLPSERTADKKFTVWRKFTHNNSTHYNYYFNAKNKLNLVLEMARESQQDDYSKMLSFFPYSLDNTSSQSTELDSVIYKSTAGILTHDLRTDWVDNLYLLIGKSYFYRKEFDSAALTFQFINFNLFPRKKKEDDNRVIGENDRAGSSALSIADREKRNIIQKIFTLPPSRNDALVWLARTYVEQEKFGEAAGLISILLNDPNLPKRLLPMLHEVNAYWFYKQVQYDSAATYLEKSIKGIDNKADKSRQLFLLAQLYETTRQFDKASFCYKKSAKTTTSPLMDISAHLNNAKMMRTQGNIKELDRSIALLEKMASKDKYEAYRDIILYSAGMLSLQKPDTVKSIGFFKKSLQKNQNNDSYKNKAHLILGKIAYDQKSYKEAADHYDSLDVSQIDASQEDTADIAVKKNALRRVADYLIGIQQSDSLLMLAALSPAELDVIIKKEVKKAKKANAKESNDFEEDIKVSNLGSDFSKNGGQTDLFASSAKGEWYFYNTSVKSKGFNEFTSKWGKRPNADNWRRKSAISMNGVLSSLNGVDDPLNQPLDSTADVKVIDNSYDALYANVPLKEEQKSALNLKLTDDLIGLAQIFEMELLDFNQALNTYEIYLQRFPDSLKGGQVYLAMYHCYQKLGNLSAAKHYKDLLDSLFADSKYVKMIKDPASLQPEKNNPEAEKRYQQFYELMLAENYDSAIALKEKIDCDYGDHFWTPQLLYMWGICAVKCTSDSQAIFIFNSLIQNYPSSALAEKSKRIIDVLQRKNEIIFYLDSSNIIRTKDDPKKKLPVFVQNDDKSKIIDSSTSLKPNVNHNVVQSDSASIHDDTFDWANNQPYKVIMLLDQVDRVLVNETSRAVQKINASENYTSITTARKAFINKIDFIEIGDFNLMADAQKYALMLKKKAPVDFWWVDAKKYKIFFIATKNLTKIYNEKKYETYFRIYQIKFP